MELVTKKKLMLYAGEVRALVAFIRAGFDAEANVTGLPPGDPSRGRQVFETADFPDAPAEVVEREERFRASRERR